MLLWIVIDWSRTVFTHSTSVKGSLERWQFERVAGSNPSVYQWEGNLKEAVISGVWVHLWSFQYPHSGAGTTSDTVEARDASENATALAGVEQQGQMMDESSFFFPRPVNQHSHLARL